MKISIIAAVGKNRELGKNNDLIWHIKEDLKFFRDLTTNHVIVMGRKTFESLPHMLPNRHHVVISRNNSYNECEMFDSIESFLESYKDYDDEVFIIGGSSIYDGFLKYADNMYLTEIDASDINADVFFPKFDENDYKKEILSSLEDNGIKYKHVLYRRFCERKDNNN